MKDIKFEKINYEDGVFSCDNYIIVDDDERTINFNDIGLEGNGVGDNFYLVKIDDDNFILTSFNPANSFFDYEKVIFLDYDYGEKQDKDILCPTLSVIYHDTCLHHIKQLLHSEMIDTYSLRVVADFFDGMWNGGYNFIEGKVKNIIKDKKPSINFTGTVNNIKSERC